MKMSGKIAEWQHAIIEVLESDCKALELSNTPKMSFWGEGPGQESDLECQEWDLVGLTLWCEINDDHSREGEGSRSSVECFCFPAVIIFSPYPSLLEYINLVS